MTVRRALLSSSRHKLRSNTITAALHISDGLDDYQPNMIIDLYVRKIGNVYDKEEDVCVYVYVCVCSCVCVCVSKSFEK